MAEVVGVKLQGHETLAGATALFCAIDEHPSLVEIVGPMAYTLLAGASAWCEDDQSRAYEAAAELLHDLHGERAKRLALLARN